MKITLFFLTLIIFGCNTESETSEKKKNPTLVSPTIDKYGHFRKCYVRMPYSTDKNALMNRNRSKYYYNTRGKYNKK